MSKSFVRTLIDRAAQGAAIAGLTVATASMAHAGGPSWADVGDTVEKCAGIARAGMNDCGANAHTCAGMAETDNDPNEWVYVPEGVCERIAGGRVIETKVVEAE